MAFEKHFKKKLTIGLVLAAIITPALPSDSAFAEGHLGSDVSQPGTIQTNASCSKGGCDGTDPANTGCTSDSKDVVSLPSSQMGGLNATLYLRWSNTCQTNWARVNLSDDVYYDIKVVRQSDGRTEQFSYDTGGSYTNQLYTGSIKAQACLRYRWWWWPQYTGWYCTAWT